MTTRHRILPLAAALYTVMAGDIVAQTRTTIEIDQQTGTVSVNGAISRSDTVKVPSSDEVVVTVINTNSALYTYSLTKEGIEVKEIAQLQEGLKKLAPYLIDLPTTLIAPPDSQGRIHQLDAATGKRRSTVDSTSISANADKKLYDAAKTLKDTISSFDAIVNGPDGIDAYRVRLLSVIQSMRPKGSLATVIATNKSWLSVIAGSRVLTDSVLSVSHRLRSATWQFDSLLSQYGPDLPDTKRAVYAAISKKAHDAIEGTDKALTAASGLEKTAELLLNARETVTITRAPGIRWNSGQSITLNIKHRDNPDLTRIASPDTTYTVHLMPEWVARPAVGLTAMWLPEAAYPKYSTKAAGSEFEIIEVAKQAEDHRALYGLTIGVSWSPLSWGDSWAIWLPEVIVSPSDDIRAFGFGAAISWNIIKLGTGVAWVKHTVLNDQKVGQRLGDEKELSIASSYGPFVVYIGLSVIGWQPFAP